MRRFEGLSPYVIVFHCYHTCRSCIFRFPCLHISIACPVGVITCRVAANKFRCFHGCAPHSQRSFGTVLIIVQQIKMIRLSRYSTNITVNLTYNYCVIGSSNLVIKNSDIRSVGLLSILIDQFNVFLTIQESFALSY